MSPSTRRAIETFKKLQQAERQHSLYRARLQSELDEQLHDVPIKELPDYVEAVNKIRKNG